MPISAIASTTAGLIVSAGAVPADRTTTRSPACVGEQRGGHLRAAGVVDADEQHFRRIADGFGSHRSASSAVGVEEADRGRSATTAPTTCMTMNIGADDGAMPAKVSESVRATVTAGLAKLVDDVNQ